MSEMIFHNTTFLLCILTNKCGYVEHKRLLSKTFKKNLSDSQTFGQYFMNNVKLWHVERRVVEVCDRLNLESMVIMPIVGLHFIIILLTAAELKSITILHCPTRLPVWQTTSILATAMQIAIYISSLPLSCLLFPHVWHLFMASVTVSLVF